MKLLALVLLLLIALMQYPLWFGKTSWKKVWEADQDVIAARENNVMLQHRNGMLEAEVNDLKQGIEAIEERARSDLGMIKQDEILFQIVTGAPQP
ncbi:cell division protein FtsB [Nitrosomonas sp. JL21]|uniref:cell division protein FtsB n=1 Tax=Nitrosomonas sp. JL21 TaxID=153949 RepID=UPI00136FF502|nr:cell division protein FtsB [Nitrosomonas sp. JL21]MBL8496501.1 cell division protein FtsB [Nitrosomonas sp.]MCC7091244.1 cell division protein FtsB [Nitrosomonas sp.]MXS76911.1 cell division protein FtsB [Nitrosomonas sp. JL21]